VLIMECRREPTVAAPATLPAIAVKVVTVETHGLVSTEDVVGAAVILADPIFQGLALALMAGEVASLLIGRMAVPVLCFKAKGRAATGCHAQPKGLATQGRNLA
jgi:hypothetical protein